MMACKIFSHLTFSFSCETTKNITLWNAKVVLCGCCRNVWIDEDDPWIAQDLHYLILAHQQLTDAVREVDAFSFIRTAWRKTPYLLKNFQGKEQWAVSCRKRNSCLGTRNSWRHGFLLQTDHSLLTTLWAKNMSTACRDELADGQWCRICLCMTQKRCESWLLVSPTHVLCHLRWWMMTVHLLHKLTDWLQLQESNIKSFAKHAWFNKNNVVF